jgi:hypothetical protein
VSDLEALTASDFAPLLHSRFRVAADDSESFDAELIEISEGAARGPRRAQFSPVFRGGPSPPLHQRIFRVEHDELGALDIFLVPLGPDDVGQRYEAVFT